MPTPTALCPQLPDSELIARVRTGDAECFAELYRRHRKLADRVARRAGVSPHDTEDVVAEAFAKVLRAMRRGHGPTETFTGYLALAVRRVAWSAQRDSKRCRPTDDLDLLDAVSDSADVPSIGDPVTAAFAALSQEARSLLWRVVVDGDPIGEIARDLGKTPNSVSAAAFRARARLRSEYSRRLSA